MLISFARRERSRGTLFSFGVVGLRRLAMLVVASLSLLAGCVSNGTPKPKRNAVDSATPGPALDGPTLFAAGRPSAEAELEDLEGVPGNSAMLRRAFLLLQCRRPDSALDAAAQVLYGPTKPSANEEAFARYARAEAYAQLGRPEHGRYDRDLARQLALDGELQRRLRPTVVPETEVPAAPVGELSVLDRSRWGPRKPVQANVEPMGKPRRITIHHSALYFRDTSLETAAAQIQMIQRDHMQNRGYGDIGYHFLIDPSGRIWEGRELKYQGAHASGANNVRNIGVCLLGNFMRGREGHVPTQKQVAAMRELVTTMMRRYDFGGDSLYVHNDFKPTDCPGPLLEPIVADLARELRRGGMRTAGAAK